MRDSLNWGIIGTGAIADDFCEALEKSTQCRVVGAVGSSIDKSRAFGRKWGLSSQATTLPELLADTSVEVIYVATPHPSHEVQAVACIEAGKHVLCEKPITVDAKSAARVIGAARARGVFLMEAFMYRCHPLLGQALALLKDGAIGPIRHVRADFGFKVPRHPEGRLFKPALGGGSILDVGCYTVSFARLIAGVESGQPACEPTKLVA
ncbi:MAG TPA: Gfo/Idh/MocA family oxidoreductase, partial [Polyangiaceae bacterium]|nr:Gfo/Idh/MocA family oxidoreductase [Polyangiaceae bacterium]